ncbi:MAG: hypothetical protein KN64_02795 [Sulfurovum sp. AS07-7]|nr:MAG: hypothetical protein KN64_02795 [Sulfurovum sp. AS07-7]
MDARGISFIANNSHKDTVELINKSTDIIEETSESFKRYVELISEDITKFKSIKYDMQTKLLHESNYLLRKGGYESLTTQENRSFDISFDCDDHIEAPTIIKSIYSGRFSGFLLALLVATIIALAWIVTASVYQNLPIFQIPTDENMSKVLLWIGGGMIGYSGNALSGALILGFSSLLFAWIVYAIRVSIQSKKNISLATQIYDASLQYCNQKEHSIVKMKEIDNHFLEIFGLCKNYGIFIEEYNAVLRRVFHIEGIVLFEDYVEHSKQSMRELSELVTHINTILNTPISMQNHLNLEAIEISNSAKNHYQEFIKRVYPRS